MSIGEEFGQCSLQTHNLNNSRFSGGLTPLNLSLCVRQWGRRMCTSGKITAQRSAGFTAGLPLRSRSDDIPLCPI